MPRPKASLHISRLSSPGRRPCFHRWFTFFHMALTPAPPSLLPSPSPLSEARCCYADSRQDDLCGHDTLQSRCDHSTA